MLVVWTGVHVLETFIMYMAGSEYVTHPVLTPAMASMQEPQAHAWEKVFWSSFVFCLCSGSIFTAFFALLLLLCSN